MRAFSVGILRNAAVALASIGVLCPQLLQASGPQASRDGREAARPATIVKDIALGQGGTLKGAVLDVQGQPVVGSSVVLAKADQMVAQTQTDEAGRFAIGRLTGGVYQVATVSGVEVYRLWAPNTAPPAAGREVLIVAGDALVRGQQGAGMLRWLGNPWMLAAIVATAIAVPLAMDDDAS